MKEQAWFSWKMQTSKSWSDMAEVLKYTKIDFIDYDHKMLVEYSLRLNQLINQLDQSFSLKLLEETGQLLNDLYKYAEEHFDREEVFMEAYNLPEIKAHKIVHNEILKILLNIINDFNNGKIKVGQELKSQITEWLIFHINEFDAKFFEIENWSENLANANSWDEVKDIISLTGLNEIDKQHESLTILAIELLSGKDEDFTPEKVEHKFKQFEKSILEHFDYEESFIRKYNIVDTYNHEGEHLYFIIKIKEHYKMLIENPGKRNEIKQWLLTWWINHINVTDQKTFEYSNWAQNVIDQAESLEDMSILLRRTNIAPVDEDHLKFMDLTFELNSEINRFMNDKTINSADSKLEILAMFSELLYLAEYHFYREEQLMKKYDLPDYKSHKREHESILSRIRTVYLEYKEDRMSASQNMKNMLLDWWLNHTNTIDYRTLVIHADDKQLEEMLKEV